jgi:lipopolysaccharide transport system permease protein
MIKYGIQLAYYSSAFMPTLPLSGSPAQVNAYALLFPLLVIMLAGLGLGFGLVITSMTTKYRDLVFLLQFGIQLAMYATPVIYPLSQIPKNISGLPSLIP